MEPKKIYDSIHGLITLDNIYWRIIDTPEFQRLRDLHQLGTGFLVFPSANHKRFEHSIGTCYLANRFIMFLRENQPELNITDNDIKCVSIAGLCHDIGHGPFSHTFEFFVNTKIDRNWDHEYQSEVMFRRLVKINNIDLNEEEVNFIVSLIHGNYQKEFTDKEFLYEIIHNTRNSLDVDKFDYMARDTRKIGVPTQSYDFTVLTNNARVINNHICFSSNVSFSVIELFQIRYKLYKQYYFSREIKATDCMMMDVFSEANDFYNFKEYITNTSKYLELKDNILEEIQHSNEKDLKKARSLVRRISENRDLYVFVGETIIFDKEKADKINEQFFFEITGLDQNIVCLFKGKPSSKVNTSSVSLFEKNKAQNSYQVKSMNQDEITHIIPFNFIEYIIRVYCKDKNHLESSKTAFKKFCSIIGEELVE